MPAGSQLAKKLDVGLGQVKRNVSGRLIAGIAPEQWLFIGAQDVSFSTSDVAADDGDGAGPLVTIVSLTHSTALIRLVGHDSAKILRKLCGINFDDRVTPNHFALRTSMARIVFSLIREDVAAMGKRSIPSYLILCDRSAGQYLFNILLDAGQEFEIDIQGFAHDDASLTSI